MDQIFPFAVYNIIAARHIYQNIADAEVAHIDHRNKEVFRSCSYDEFVRLYQLPRITAHRIKELRFIAELRKPFIPILDWLNKILSK